MSAPPERARPDAVVADPQVRLARAAWSRLVEPGDPVAGALVASLGPVEALAAVAAVAGGAGTDHLVTGLGPVARRRLLTALGGWLPRWGGDPHRDLAAIEQWGGRLVVPEDGSWPDGLADLGPAAPLCLWQRGSADTRALLAASVAVIGARAATAYGERVAGEIAAGLVDAGWTVLSGGAYGIDAAAHRAALAVGGRTVAVLAGGLDRPYPAGNVRLLTAAVEQGGAVLSEVPVGAVPSRTRFLQRNRVIAAAARATVVVEAAWRSGALSTAGHAVGLLRPVGAVPGPVTSAASVGCHRLLREGAVCVTDAAEVLELVGVGPAPEPATIGQAGDGLPWGERRVLDALPRRGGLEPEALARRSGLSVAETRAALGRLGTAGHAIAEGCRWRLSTGGTREERDTRAGEPGPSDRTAG